MTESEHPPGAQIPDWVERYVRLRSRPIAPPGPYNWGYFENLNKFVAHILRSFDLKDLGMMPIFTLDRRSRWIKSSDGDKSFFLFDCLHAATLRMLYYHVTIGAAQEQILYFLKEHIASCLLAFDDDVAALALLDEKIPFFYFTTSRHPDYYLGQARETRKYLPAPFYPDAFLVLDVFKSCHEIFHFVAPQGDNSVIPSFLEGARKKFDALLDSTYPEELSSTQIEEWRDKGTFDDERDIDPKKISARFSSYRKELLAQRDTIVEEIACDWFALRATLQWQMHAELHAQQREETTNWTIEGVFAYVFLTSHLIRLLEYFTELARDIARGRALFEDQSVSRAIHIRNLASYQFALHFVDESSSQPRELKGIDFWTREKRLVFDDIHARYFGIRRFLDSYVQTPFSRAFNTCVLAMRTKLSDPAINSLYTGYAGSLTFEQKLHYTLPVIERFAYSDYFRMGHKPPPAR